MLNEKNNQFARDKGTMTHGSLFSGICWGL